MPATVLTGGSFAQRKRRTSLQLTPPLRAPDALSRESAEATKLVEPEEVYKNLEMALTLLQQATQTTRSSVSRVVKVRDLFPSNSRHPVTSTWPTFATGNISERKPGIRLCRPLR
jgi:hypothetical protein